MRTQYSEHLHVDHVLDEKVYNQDYATWDTASRFCLREVFDEYPCEENRENGNKVNGHYMYWQKERCRSCLFYLTKSIWVIKLCEVAIDSCFVG